MVIDSSTCTTHMTVYTVQLMHLNFFHFRPMVSQCFSDFLAFMCIYSVLFTASAMERLFRQTLNV